MACEIISVAGNLGTNLGPLCEPKVRSKRWQRHTKIAHHIDPGKSEILKRGNHLDHRWRAERTEVSKPTLHLT